MRVMLESAWKLLMFSSNQQSRTRTWFGEFLQRRVQLLAALVPGNYECRRLKRLAADLQRRARCGQGQFLHGGYVHVLDLDRQQETRMKCTK